MDDESVNQFNESMPFAHQKISICRNTEELSSMLERYPDFSVCLYLAHKTDQEWERSTSRVYMNQVLPKLLYIPVDLSRDEIGELRRVYAYASENPRIIAINHTIPHHSNKVLYELFATEDDQTIGVLVKGEDGVFVPYDLNGPSFIQAFSEDYKLGEFKDRKVVIIGVGGAGEAIARSIKLTGPREMIFIDPRKKEKLLTEGSNRWYSSVTEYLADALVDEELIIINASGTAVDADSGMDRLLRLCHGSFVDIRAQLDTELVERAQKIGRWNGATGYGMNSRNDYVLLLRIAQKLGADAPAFDVFRKLVLDASV